MYDGVSILLPVYGGDNLEHLKQALMSIHLQEKDQLVIVFDGPGCESHWKIIEEFVADVHYEYAVGCSTQERGLGNNLNFGLDLCTRNLIGRFDADDYFLSDRSLIAKKLDLEAADIFAFSIAEFISTPDRLSSYRRVPSRLLHSGDLSMRNILNHMAVYYRRDKILAIGGYRNVTGFEDYDLWLRSLKAGYKIKGSSKIITCARIGNSFVKRRSGYRYAQYEWTFFLRCIKEDLIPLNVTHIWIARIVVRFIPKVLLSSVYRWLHR
jgi:glycosyltransferase involved in cell wall biosynthesis